jgi:uncharacterized membrane protein
LFNELAIVVAVIAVIVVLKSAGRISKLEDKIAQLHDELSGMRRLMLSDFGQSTAKQESQHEAQPEVDVPVPPTVHPMSAKSSESPRASQKPRLTAERKPNKLLTSLQENWLVWVGALAMLVGGGYLVQVIGSHIEFSPIVRVTIAFALSLVTLMAGVWFHRKEQKNSERAKRAQGFTYVPAAITSTGLTGIYCTVIFAFVFYQLLSPTLSLLILAMAAFSSLALSLRQGPLMAVLGLVGGYTAPLWIGGTEPNYLLLAGYFSAISLAATVLMQRVRRAWLAPSIALPHVFWMLIMIESMPKESLFPWLAIFLSVTLYLIYAVPRLGWQLLPRNRHCQGKWTHQPIVTSLMVVVLMFAAVERLEEVSTLELAYLYAVLLAIVWLPALRKGWSLRLFLPAMVVSSVSAVLLSFALDTFSMTNSPSSILTALAISIGLFGWRTLSQIQGGDRTRLTCLYLLVLAPVMTLSMLMYAHECIESHVWVWTLFTALVAGCYGYLGLRLKDVARACSAIVHAMVAGISLVWLSDVWLTTVISAQVAMMALQAKHRLFHPANWAIKVAMLILVVRLTLLPFIPDWQPMVAGHWAWVLISYLPSLMILGYARSIMQRSDGELANWFEGAFLHVFLMVLFTQTNYWLTGDYGYLDYFDFTSMAVFANQALVMGLVYSHRSLFAQKLKPVYQSYSYVLWGAFVLQVLALNTFESPLLVSNVSAQATPVFNMLTVGWLLPASVLIATVVRGWNTLRISHYVVAGLGAILAAAWLGMSIRQFWQADSMTMSASTSMAELFSYSVAGLVVGGLLTWGGVTRKALTVQRIGLIVLACVALKVFLWDVRTLDGFWRAISFLGLGASLMALGWLFQKLNRSVTSH